MPLFSANANELHAARLNEKQAQTYIHMEKEMNAVTTAQKRQSTTLSVSLAYGRSMS
jgi:hypothetical protein